MLNRLFVWGLLIGVGACGDPPLAALAKADGAGFDATLADVAIEGKATDGVADSAADAATAAETSVADTPQADQTAMDTPPDAAPDGPKPDAAPLADLGLTDFALVSSDPTAGSGGLPLQFVIKLVFSTKIKPESTTKYTITVRTNGAVPLPCKFAAADNVLTITASSAAPPTSRVDVVLGPLVQSNQGVPLQETTLHWYSAGWPSMAGYAALAERFAPVVRQAVAGPSDLLRAADFDNDWNLANNPTNQSQFAASAAVAWTVAETQSHTFLTYLFYWPGRTGVAPGVPFDNDTAGAQVVLARASGKPVALQTFFKSKADEQAWLWLTQESGWPTKSKFVRAALPQDQLFAPVDPAACASDALAPACKRRYPAYLTAGSHQSCLWLDNGEVGDQQCVLSTLIKEKLALLMYQPAAVAPEPGAPSEAGTPASYVLHPLLEQWWARRDEAGPAALCVDTQFSYLPDSGRPPGPGYGLGSRLLSGQGGDFGRPPWAWRWKPGTFASSYYDLPRGTPFFDPAWLLWQRLGAEPVGIAKWNAATKQGLSVDYCFNPGLGIDVRASAACQL